MWCPMSYGDSGIIFQTASSLKYTRAISELLVMLISDAVD